MRGARGAEATDVPQLFALTCECGQVHNGHRKSKPQRIVCRECGSALFILAKNAYPVVKLPDPKRTRTGRARRSKTRTSGDRWQIADFEQLSTAVGHSTRKAAGALAGGVRSGLSRTREGATQQVHAVVTSLRRAITPFRVVLASVLLMFAGTIAWSVHASRLEAFREQLRVEFAAGQKAISDGDLVAARGHFAAAAEAVRALGLTDVRSRQARQLWLETTAMTRLMPGSLLTMLDEADRTTRTAGETAWRTEFGGRYHGSWLIIEAPVRVQSRAGGAVSVHIDLPILVGPDEREVVLESESWGKQLLPADTSAATGPSSETAEAARNADTLVPAILAAPLTDCELGSSEGVWTIRLDGREGFLWSGVDNLKTLGLLDPAAEAQAKTVAVLKQQTRLLGLE
jgi:hypothetical protein